MCSVVYCCWAIVPRNILFVSDGAALHFRGLISVPRHFWALLSTDWLFRWNRGICWGFGLLVEKVRGIWQTITQGFGFPVCFASQGHNFLTYLKYAQSRLINSNGCYDRIGLKLGTAPAVLHES